MKSRSKYFLKIIIASVFLITSPLAFADSGDTPWMTYLYIGVVISLVLATILSIRNKSAGTVGLKIVLGGVYFWVIAFIQLIVFAAIAHFSK